MGRSREKAHLHQLYDRWMTEGKKDRSKDDRRKEGLQDQTYPHSPNHYSRMILHTTGNSTETHIQAQHRREGGKGPERKQLLIHFSRCQNGVQHILSHSCLVSLAREASRKVYLSNQSRIVSQSRTVSYRRKKSNVYDTSLEH